MQNLTKQLETFGLSQIEAKIYLYLLNKPAQTILEISRNLSLPRTNIYDNSLKLIEKGLVERVIEYNTQKLKAHPLDILESVIEKNKQGVEQMQANLIDLRQKLTLTLNPLTNTEVRYFQGVEGFRQMMWNTLSATDRQHIGYSEFGRVSIVGQKFMERWMKEIYVRGIKDRVIINPTKYTLGHISHLDNQDFRKQYQNIRVLDQKVLYVSGDTTIYNHVFAVAWWKQGEVIGVEIENPELVKTQKSMFEILWKLGKPVGKSLS